MLVREFRRITGVINPISGRCCENVRDGSPECCYQIADGADLTFTKKEIAILNWDQKMFSYRKRGEVFILNRDVWTPEAILKETNDGMLANTLECASHPTRPIIIQKTVVGVAVINACNRDIALTKYAELRSELMDLWVRAVKLTGVKPYYVTWGVKKDWAIL